MAEGELLKNLCFMSYLANLFHLLQEYGFTISIKSLTLSNQSKCLSFTRMCWGISMETTVIQGSQLHPTHAFQLNSTRHRLREIWEILEVEQNQKIQCIYVYVLFQVSTLIGGGNYWLWFSSSQRCWLFSLDFCVREVHVADVYGQRSLPHHHTPPQFDWSHLAQWLSWWWFRERSIHHTVVVLVDLVIWASRIFSATSRYTAR